MNEHRFDFVIVGAGLAGLYSAVYASKFGSVALITKSTLEISNSYWAQGGIAAAIDPNDSPQFHFQDTMKAGRDLCNGDAVQILVSEGKERVLELIEMGMPFDKENGKIALGLEGGHSARRILHAGGDATGREMVNFISKFVVENKQITLFENTLVHKLIISEGECFGVYAFDIIKQQDLMIIGKTTIIASGGGSAIYSRTTNPHTSLGEGIVLAYDAGAEIESMEFIQFHPTSFYTESGETFLISEAVRGEGGLIVNQKGERFLQEHALFELAPRDVVTEAIYNELKNSGMPNVFLKLDHLEPEKIKNRFSTIYNEALKFGIDITKDLVPVAPAAHYMIGGIKTGLNAETNIKQLYAVGEVASTGVHGANRLASNSLLECLVFGKRAVDHALKLTPRIDESSIPKEENHFRIDEKKEKDFSVFKKKIAELLWTNVGIVRTNESLEFAISELESYYSEKVFSRLDYYESRTISLIEIALLVSRSALIRSESRGCHLNKDFPEENQEFQKTFILKKNKEPKFFIV